MTVKEVKPINFLYFQVQTKVTDLEKFLPVGQELYQEAVRIRVPITGPIHWHYTGFAGDEDQLFTLEVALPVASFPHDYDGGFHVKRTRDFKCVSAIHEGSWHDIPKTYGKLFDFISAHGLRAATRNREIYIHSDFENPASNVTEIQLGIE